MAFVAGVWFDLPGALAVVPMCCVTRPFDVRVSRGWLLPCLVAASIGGWSPSAQPMDGMPVQSLASGDAMLLQGWVASRPTLRPPSRWQRCVLRVDRAWAGDSLQALAVPPASHIVLRSRDSVPTFGTTLLVQGSFEPPRSRQNFHGMHEAAYLKGQGAWGTVYAQDIDRLPAGRGPAWRRNVVEPWRNQLANHLMQTLEDPARGLLWALLLGVRTALPRELTEAWRGLGMSHVLALSGMHVGVVAAGLLSLVGSVRRAHGVLVLLGGVFLYAFLGGAGSSVLRASVMVGCATASVFLGRGRVPLRNLGTAALLLSMLTPFRLHDLGFQLSCSATLGILLTAAPLTRWALQQRQAGGVRSWLCWVVPAAGVGLAAQVVTLPWILHHFGYVSWMSPLANLVLVPVVDVALVLGLLGAAVSWLLPFLAEDVWRVAGGLLHAVAWVSLRVVDSFDPRVFVRAGASTTALATVAAMAFLGMTLRGGWPRRLAGSLCVAALVSTFTVGLQSSQPDWQVTMLDIGQGDAFVVRNRQHSWLIDAGPTRPVDQGQRTIVPHLRREGIDHLRGIIVSHPHLDHYGGVRAVLDAVRVDSVYVAAASWDHAVYAGWRRSYPQVGQRGLRWHQRLPLGGGMQATVLWPPPTDVLESGANGVSLCLWIRSPERPDLVCMGDLEDDGEEQLLATWSDSLRSGRGDLVILKAGHHGSDTSSGVALLEAMAPQVALISAGRRNRYGHPSPETLQALATRDCAVLRTDRAGDIRLRWRAHSLWVQRPTGRTQPLLTTDALVGTSH